MLETKNEITQIDFFNELKANLLASLWSLLKSKLKETNVYQNNFGTIDINSIHKEFNKVIEESFQNAIKGLNIPIEKRKPLRDSILSNIDILLNWFYAQPYPDFSTNNIEIEDYSIEKEIVKVFKSLHYQIQIKRNSTISSPLEQLKQLINTNTNKIIDSQKTEINNQTQVFLNEINEIKQLITPKQISPKWPIAEDFEHIEHSIKNLHYIEAEILLKRVEANIVLLSADEKEKFYELYSNLKLSDLQNQHNAIPYIENLIIFTKDETKKKQRSILLQSIKKEYDNCILEIDNILSVTNDEFLCEIKLNCLLLLKKIQQADSFLETIKNSFTRYLIWRVRIFYYQEKYKDAEIIINNNIELFNNEKELSVLKLNILTFSLMENYHNYGFNFQKKEQIGSILTTAIELEKTLGDDIKLKESLYIAITFLLRMLNQTESSIEYYKKLEALNSKEPNFLRNYPLALVQLNKIAEAFPFFEAYLSLYPEDKFIKDIYYQCLVEKDYKKAEKILVALPLNETNIQYKTHLIKLYIDNTNFDKAESLYNLLCTSFPSNFYVRYSYVEILNKKKKFLDARQVLDSLFLEETDEMRKYIILDKIVNIDVQESFSSNYEVDITYICSLKNPYESYLHFGERLVCLLLLLQNYQKAVIIIEEIRKYDLLTKSLLRNEILCFFNTQNFQKTLELIEELKTYDKLNGNDNLIYLRSLYALGRPEEFIKNIDLLPEPNTENDYLILDTQLRNIGAKNKEIEIAHKAYKKFPQNIKIQENFIYSILGASPDIIPDEIMNDAIYCRDDYFREDSPQKKIKQVTLSLTPTIDELLMTLKREIPEEEPFDYQSVISENNIHISFLTNLNFNYIYIWESTKHLSDLYINYSTSKQIDYIMENNTAKNKIIAIDLPSLVTCYLLNILDLLPSLFTKIYISQQSINEIEQIILTKNNPLLSDINSTFYKLNNCCNSEERIDWSPIVDLVTKLKAFISEPIVEIIGYHPNPNNPFPKELFTIFSSGQIIEEQIVRYAYETNIPIMLECFPYRELLRTYKNYIGCFCIDSLLIRLLQENKISINSYCKKLSKLVISKYRVLCINHYILFEVIKYNGFTESEEINTLFKTYEDPSLYSTAWILEQTSILETKIWNSNIPAKIKEKWTIKILNIYQNRGDVLISFVTFITKAIYKAINTKQHKREFEQFWKSIHIS